MSISGPSSRAESGAISLARLPEPRVIAVVGASDMSGGNYYGARVLANLVNAGTSATVFPINPRLAGSKLLDLEVYATLSALPAVPDFVFIVAPVKFVVAALEEAAGLGVRVCIVITAESGDEAARAAFRSQVAAIAAQSGMRIIGPNSMGVMNGNLRLNGSFASSTADGSVPAGSIACLSQSGATLASMLQWFGKSRTGFSWLISTGDESASGIEALMEALVDDPTASVIMLFLEGIKDGARFRRAALASQLAGKPVVMLQVGKSDKGREAVQSHTGRVAGAREVFAAVASEAGIIQTESFGEFFGTARTLAQRSLDHARMQRKRRAAVITVSGGAASLCADQLSEFGWVLPPFKPETVDAIEAATTFAGIHNPADIGGVWRNNTRMSGTMAAIALDDTIDTIFVAIGAGGDFAKGVAEAIVSVAPTLRQEVFVSWVGMSPEVRAIFEAADIPGFDDFPLAVRAAEACAVVADNRDRRGEAATLLDLTAPGEPSESPPSDPRLWTVTETLLDLRDAGLPCAPFDIVDSVDPDIIAARSEAVGYPAVLKLSSISLNHKSDEGGVALRLADRASVHAAATTFQHIAERKGLSAPSVLVQKMAGGVEILVGIKRDAAFGLMLVLGMGGTLAELHGDVVATPLPTTPALLHRLLARHVRLGKLLDGYRGQPGVDRDALVAFLHAFARWAEAKPASLGEVDLNPVIASGAEILIVDGRVVWN